MVDDTVPFGHVELQHVSEKQVASIEPKGSIWLGMCRNCDEFQTTQHLVERKWLLARSPCLVEAGEHFSFDIPIHLPFDRIEAIHNIPCAPDARRKPASIVGVKVKLYVAAVQRERRLVLIAFVESG